MGDVQILERRILTAREAARQLRIPESTLVHWLEGGHRRGKFYPPVLRAEPSGSQEITWGEMVEARYLRAYRQRSVSMQSLRPFIADLRRAYGMPYPLAHFKPFVDSRLRFLLEVQDRNRLPASMQMVYEYRSGQLVLDPRVLDFLDRVDFDEGVEEERVVCRLYPHGKQSPVVIDPKLSSGSATVRGIRTEVLVEQANAQTPVEEIAADFGLPEEDVKAAIAYEWSSAA